MSRQPRRNGFTLLEVMVTLGLVVLLIGLTIRPLQQTAASGVRVKREAAAIAANIRFLELIARDSRTYQTISAIDPFRVVFDDHDKDTVSWRLDGKTAWRETATTAKTGFPVHAEWIFFAWNDPPPSTTYFLVRGRFEGIGEIEQGLGMRLDDGSDTL